MVELNKRGAVVRALHPDLIASISQERDSVRSVGDYRSLNLLWHLSQPFEYSQEDCKDRARGSRVTQWVGDLRTSVS
jgi:hypothetical protein